MASRRPVFIALQIIFTPNKNMSNSTRLGATRSRDISFSTFFLSTIVYIIEKLRCSLSPRVFLCRLKFVVCYPSMILLMVRNQTQDLAFIFPPLYHIIQLSSRFTKALIKFVSSMLEFPKGGRFVFMSLAWGFPFLPHLVNITPLLCIISMNILTMGV